MFRVSCRNCIFLVFFLFFSYAKFNFKNNNSVRLYPTLNSGQPLSLIPDPVHVGIRDREPSIKGLIFTSKIAPVIAAVIGLCAKRQNANKFVLGIEKWSTRVATTGENIAGVKKHYLKWKAELKHHTDHCVLYSKISRGLCWYVPCCWSSLLVPLIRIVVGGKANRPWYGGPTSL